MDRKTSSRVYDIDLGGVVVTPYELQLLKSQANQILLNNHGFDSSRAWTTAVLNMLIKRGLLPNTENLKSGEKPS